jgi:hypothetical protein
MESKLSKKEMRTPKKQGFDEKNRRFKCISGCYKDKESLEPKRKMLSENEI